MADITITDQTQLSASITISDDSPFALSKLTHLQSANLPIVGDFAKPLDRCSFEQVSLGAALSSPPMLLGNQANLTLSATGNAQLSICQKKGDTLFAKDGFAPDIAIGSGQCWVGLELATTVAGKVAANLDGFGVALNQSTEVRFGTYRLFGAAGPLPTLAQALKELLEKYAIAASSDAILSQLPGTVYTVGTKGKVTISASYSLPASIDPLATLSLPFQYKLAVQPSATAQLTGSIALTGDFIVRSHRPDGSTLVFGLYKKKETTLTASFTASAGVGANLGTTDVLTPILNAVIPGPDTEALRLDKEQSEELKSALDTCIDQSFSAAFNACCSASVADEAALVYSIDLTSANDQTAKALAAALRGDWSALDGLPNAKPIRNIARELHERKHQLKINLLGLLNAASIQDYLASSTVLHDDSGQIILTDRDSATSLSVVDQPYAAKPDKLRSLLAQAFLATISYGAAARALGSHLAIKAFTIRQSYLDYKVKASAQDLRKYILLARSLGIPVSSDWDAILQNNNNFDHTKFYLDTEYDLNAVMQMFYVDVRKRLPRSQQELDQLGREAKLSLLDPTATTTVARRLALSSDTTWNAMTSNGNVQNFRFIEGLTQLPDAALGAVSADYIDIRWWSDAMQQIPAKLTAVLQSIDASTTNNPLEDQSFMSRQKELQAALVTVTAKSHSAFADGWDMAVIHRCATHAASTQRPFTQMDIGWNNQFQHYEVGSPLAAGATGGL